MTGPFAPMTLLCPDCGQEWEGLTIQDGAACRDCGRARYAARLAAANTGRPFTVETIGGACPTQATGRTAADRPYYFRARHGEWTLDVGMVGWPEYGDWPHSRIDGYEFLVASGDDPSGGWMEDADVLAILDHHLGGGS